MMFAVFFYAIGWNVGGVGAVRGIMGGVFEFFL